MEGEKVSLTDVVKTFEGVHGGSFTVEHTSIAEAEQRVKDKGVAVFFDYISVLCEQGLFDVGQNDNALVPGWKPLTVRETLKK